MVRSCVGAAMIQSLSDRHFRIAFEAAGIGMVLSNLQGRGIKYNQTFCDFVGYTEAELLANSNAMVSHPEDFQKDMATLQRWLMGGAQGVHQYEKRYIHRNGHVVWGFLTVT